MEHSSRMITIDAQEFCSLDGFYVYLDKFLLEGNCPWGRNLDSLDEIVTYHLNYTSDKSKNVGKIVWLNFKKSELELSEIKAGKKTIEIIEEIFSSNPDIKFEKR